MAGNIPGCSTLFLMDACYSGFAADDPSSDRRPVSASKGSQILTAGSSKDRAFEADGHGLFTRHVLTYFRYAEKMKRPASGANLASYVIPSVKKETGGWQTPQFSRAGDDILIVKSASRSLASQVAMVRP
jgi:hypothetical protein